MKQCDFPGRHHTTHEVLADEYNGSKACNGVDPCATVRQRVHHIYLATPLDAQAQSEVQTGYHRVFNLILWLLYTGMQWKCLPVPTDAKRTPAIHYTTVYKVFAK